MRTEWVRSYAHGEPVESHLRLIADDGSEVVLLERDELALICATAMHEEPEIAQSFIVQTQAPETGEAVTA